MPITADEVKADLNAAKAKAEQLRTQELAKPPANQNATSINALDNLISSMNSNTVVVSWE